MEGGGGGEEKKKKKEEVVSKGRREERGVGGSQTLETGALCLKTPRVAAFDEATVGGGGKGGNWAAGASLMEARWSRSLGGAVSWVGRSKE